MGTHSIKPKSASVHYITYDDGLYFFAILKLTETQKSGEIHRHQHIYGKRKEKKKEPENSYVIYLIPFVK